MENNNQKDMAIVGIEDVITLFGAVGIEPVKINSALEADKALNKCSNEGKKIIFISEDVYEQIPDVIEKYSQKAYPIIMPLPLDEECNGVGVERIRKSVEQAIGVSLF